MSDSTIEQLEHFKKVMEPTPPFLEALIVEKQAHQKLRARIERLRDWYSERGEFMYNLYEQSLDRQFKNDSDFYSFTADQLSAVLDPGDEGESDDD